MRWRVIIPGEPLSWNHAYRDVFIPRADGGTVRGRAKTPECVAYQQTVAFITAASRPTGWLPGDWIAISACLFMRRARDGDNTLKVLLDAVATGLRVNDKCFLPSIACIHAGVPRGHERVELTFTDLPANHCGHDRAAA